MTSSIPPNRRINSEKVIRLKAGLSATEKFARLGLQKDMDFILHLPLRYEDESTIVEMRSAALRGGSVLQVEGVVSACEVQNRPRRQLIVTLTDDSGQIVLRFLNFYASQLRQMTTGVRLRARGELKHGLFGPEIVHPTYKVVTLGAPLSEKLLPVYPSAIGISQTMLRQAISGALKRADLSDTLPPLVQQNLKTKLGLDDFASAVNYLHMPPLNADQDSLSEHSDPAWQRMKFDELLAQQLSLKRSQAARRSKGAMPMAQAGHFSQQFLQLLPFALTPAQQRVFNEISLDLAQAFPMQRLLQGDVGSGKPSSPRLPLCWRSTMVFRPSSWRRLKF